MNIYRILVIGFLRKLNISLNISLIQGGLTLDYILGHNILSGDGKVAAGDAQLSKNRNFGR